MRLAGRQRLGFGGGVEALDHPQRGLARLADVERRGVRATGLRGQILHRGDRREATERGKARWPAHGRGRDRAARHALARARVRQPPGLRVVRLEGRIDGGDPGTTTPPSDSRSLSAAPQSRHMVAVASPTAPHHWQVRPAGPPAS